jgi:hypothetical protein
MLEETPAHKHNITIQSFTHFCCVYVCRCSKVTLNIFIVYWIVLMFVLYNKHRIHTVLIFIVSPFLSVLLLELFSYVCMHFSR